jgi:hypothetical protein
VIAGNLNATGLSLSGNVVSGIATTANITGGNINGILNGSGANVSSISATNITTGTLAQVRLANAAVTLGSTALTLGDTVTAVTGLTSIAATTFTGALTGAATSAASATNVSGTNANLGFSTSAVTVGNGGQAGPQVQSQGGGAAVMSFHRPGAYAINMGLDSDNVFRIGGWSDGTGVYRFQLTAAGVATVTATSARYADLAEYYAADAEYEPGTVLSFGGDQEVTIATGINDVRVAGVVSTNPAYAMNTAIEAEHTVALALTGRVPTLVVGAVAKGDMMVSAGGGRAKACATPVLGTVIGKALQDHPGGAGTIEIVVGRM